MLLILIVKNLVASLLGFDEQIYSRGKYTTNKIIDIMGFNTINIHCNIISRAKDNGKDTDILYTFNITEPHGYMIIIIPTNILYQNVTEDRIEYIEFHIKDEHGRTIDFNGDVLSFTLHSVLQLGKTLFYYNHNIFEIVFFPEKCLVLIVMNVKITLGSKL